MAISSNGLAGLRTGVCTSTTRPSGPYEGQMIYETDTDLTYIWGGSAWQQVSGGTAVGNSGLVYVTSATVGTTVSSVTITNCFNSSYDAYEVVVSNVDGSSGTSALGLQLVDSGGTPATTNYKSTGFYMTYVSTTVNGINQSLWECSLSATNFGGKISIFNPFLAVVSYFNNVSTDDSYLRVYGGTHTTAASYVSLKLIPNAGTITGGTITVYGYRKA